MDTQTVTTHDPCPQCGGFDSALLVDDGPGYDAWRCSGCNTGWTIEIQEPIQE